MFQKVKHTALLLFLALFTNFQAQAEFLFDPIIVLLNAPNGKGSASVTLSNPTDMPTRMQLSLSEWELNDENEVFVLEPDKESGLLQKYVKINPLQFTLEPKQKRIVRIACALPPELPDGEYPLLLNMLEIGSERTNLGDTEKYNFGLVINKQISIGTYIRKGDPKKLLSEAKIESLQLLGKTEEGIINYELSYSNKGSVHTRRMLGLRFFDAAGALLLESPYNGTLLMLPTSPKQPLRKFHSQFQVPEELRHNPNLSAVEFSFIDQPIDGRIPLPTLKTEQIKL